jgi:hypothetical protein
MKHVYFYPKKYSDKTVHDYIINNNYGWFFVGGWLAQHYGKSITIASFINEEEAALFVLLFSDRINVVKIDDRNINYKLHYRTHSTSIIRLEYGTIYYSGGLTDEIFEYLLYNTTEEVNMKTGNGVSYRKNIRNAISAKTKEDFDIILSYMISDEIQITSIYKGKK